MSSCINMIYSATHQWLLQRNILQKVTLHPLHITISSMYEFWDWPSVVKLDEIVGMHNWIIRLSIQISSFLRITANKLVQMVFRSQIELVVLGLLIILQKHFQNLSVFNKWIIFLQSCIVKCFKQLLGWFWNLKWINNRMLILPFGQLFAWIHTPWKRTILNLQNLSAQQYRLV